MPPEENTMTILFTALLTGDTPTLGVFLLCTFASLLLGALIAFVWSRKASLSQGLLLSLILLPAIVQVVIMMVNGNIGVGIATAGVFTLVRFRSAAGSAEEITAIFLCMAVGLLAGMGYPAAAALFSLILCLVFLLLHRLPLGKPKSREQVLKITIPENLDFEHIFDDVLDRYTDRWELTEVRTRSPGSLYRLQYTLELSPDASVQELINDLRVRNENLEISCGRPVTRTDLL